MSEKDKLKARVRTEDGRRAVKKLRAEGFLPGVVYGRKKEPMNLAVAARDFAAATHGHSGGHVYNLSIEDEGEPRTVIVKEMHRHPVRGEVVHVDFLEISMNVKLDAVVPLRLIGEPHGVKEGGILDPHIREVHIIGFPADLPEFLELDISALGVNESIKADAIITPPAVELHIDPEAMVASILPPKLVAAEEEVVEGEEEEAAAEPELVKKKEGEESEE